MRQRKPKRKPVSKEQDIAKARAKARADVKAELAEAERRKRVGGKRAKRGYKMTNPIKKKQ